MNCKLFYEKESKLNIYENLLFYYFNLTKRKENDIAKKDKKNNKPIFMINEIMINFNFDEEGKNEFNNTRLEPKNIIKNIFPKENNRFNLDNSKKKLMNNDYNN